MSNTKEQAADFWKRVNQELKRQGKTQIELCEKQGLPLNSLRARMSMQSAPNVFDAQKIADFLEVPLEFLITGTSPANLDTRQLDALKNRLSRIKTICEETD